MKRIFLGILILAASLFVTSIVSASTTLEYTAQCQYFNARQVLKYSGKCHANWGAVMLNLKEAYERYILTYPNSAEIVVYINSDGSVTVNDIPAISLKSKKGFEKVITTEGEVFGFTTPPE